MFARLAAIHQGGHVHPQIIPDMQIQNHSTHRDTSHLNTGSGCLIAAAL